MVQPYVTTIHCNCVFQPYIATIRGETLARGSMREHREECGLEEVNHILQRFNHIFSLFQSYISTICFNHVLQSYVSSIYCNYILQPYVATICFNHFFMHMLQPYISNPEPQPRKQYPEPSALSRSSARARGARSAWSNPKPYTPNSLTACSNPRCLILDS